MGGCPFHSGGSGSSDEDGPDQEAQGGERRERGTVERRTFVKSALLIGGASAVASLGRVAGVTTNTSAGVGAISAGARLNRQHAWDAFEAVTTGSGNTLQPENSLVLLLEYEGEGEPSPGHRRRVEDALTSIEQRFDWSSGGVLFTMAYSASYFERFEEDPPAGAAPSAGETVVGTVAELTDLADTNDDVTPDEYDAALLLASANPANVLAVEAALWGEGEVEFDATFEGIFARPEGWPERRVGFAGPAFQDREQEYESKFLADDQEIPVEAPLSMGFIAGFGASIPEEEAVTLKHDQVFPGPGLTEDVPDLPYVGEVGERDPGVFAQGTLKHLSHLELDLESWYGVDSDRRRNQMYSPYHTREETRANGGNKPGSGLVVDDDSRQDGPDQNEYSTREYADRTPETAAGDDGAETSEPTVGHSQKSARSRYDLDGDGEPEQPVLRRDWDAVTPTATDGSEAAGYIFNVPMRFEESVYSLLDANYNVGFTSLDGRIDHDPVEADVKDRNGIAPFMTALRRSNWLVPPVTLRSLPYPRAADASLSVSRDHHAYTVEVSGFDGRLDPETVRFGGVEAVNRARGAEQVGVDRRGATTAFEFEADDVDLTSGDTAKLFAKETGTRKPVTGTVTV